MSQLSIDSGNHIYNHCCDALNVYLRSNNEEQIAKFKIYEVFEKRKYNKGWNIFR